MNAFVPVRKKVDRLLAARRHAVESVREEKERLEQAEKQVVYVERAQQIIQVVAKTIQEKAHDKIASVVSRCLAAVYDDPYEFKIVFEKKRGKTEARLTFVRDDLEHDPTNSSGGGVVDVAAFALRLACLMLARPRLRPVIVLDEPFKWVHSPDFRQRVRQMLETLSEDMDVQFVMVTGIEELQTGKVIEL